MCLLIKKRRQESMQFAVPCSLRIIYRVFNHTNNSTVSIMQTIIVAALDFRQIRTVRKNFQLFETSVRFFSAEKVAFSSNGHRHQRMRTESNVEQKQAFLLQMTVNMFSHCRFAAANRFGEKAEEHM